MAPSFNEIHFIHNDVFFRINMLDVNNEVIKELYDQMIAIFILEE